MLFFQVLREMWSAIGVFGIFMIFVSVKAFGEFDNNLCKDPEKQIGYCKPLSDCEPLVEVIKKSNASRSVRERIYQSVCDLRSPSLRFCCPNSGIVNVPINPPINEACEEIRGQSGRYVFVKDCEPLTDLLRREGNSEKAENYRNDALKGSDPDDPVICCPNTGYINVDYGDEDKCTDALGVSGFCTPIKACKPYTDFILRMNATKEVSEYSIGSVCIFDPPEDTTICCPSTGSIVIENNDRKENDSETPSLIFSGY
ncbi:uncharacterized protein [Venturia canescens]|uniref:uncharacterized protein n=1 Tax=Venturia canescens TaxID=32260 RepID=UPI001C9C8781|nr:uncharacterized protein LOC122412469 [Venturia canescens]